MRIDKVYIKKFKNLVDFSIDIDENQMNTIFLGENATGKSNFIEAIIIIFKYLDLKQEPPKELNFHYKIEYKIRTYKVIIDNLDNKYNIQVLHKIVGLSKEPSWGQIGKQITKSSFYKNKDLYLPKYVFTYYSGLSDRLDKLFWKHQQNFYTEIKRSDFKKEKLDELRRLFYVKQIHGFFVLLAFFSLPKIEKGTKDFLFDVMGIEDLESILFVLKEPSWSGKGDERFFGAEGLVQEFLSVLWDFSLAPIYNTETVYPDFRSRGVKQDRLYLFIKDKAKLNKFSKAYFNNSNTTQNNTDLFKALESTYISELLEEVKVKVKKRIDGKVTFKELSEGEQQLLTVIGLLIFTREEESLILLDEPDTHLNPIWKYDYLHYLNTLVKSKKEVDSDYSSTQILINTHDPLVIGSLEKSQIRIFKKNSETGTIDATEPTVSPKGLGVAGILTSELFGLKTIVDRETDMLLNERNLLLYKQSKNKLTQKDQNRLQELFEELSHKGFNHNFKDPLYTEYIINKMKELDK